MRDFSQLASALNARFPIHSELWTVYHLEQSPYAKNSYDWGRALVYHFDQGIPITRWLPLVEHVQTWIASRSEFQKLIHFVPFYEVGLNFFVQAKPPYDGGYSLTMYEEFLYNRSCQPAPWFFHQLADLHQAVAEALNSLPNSPRDELLASIIHATFIKPYDHLFWADTDGWSVYQPKIGVDDISEWEKLKP